MLFCLYIFARAKLESVWRCDAAEITNLNRLIIMEINNIGNNAGILWNVLNANGKMTETKLKKESGLGSAEFYTALGWLARESKINVEVEVKGSKSCEYFSLNA